VYDCTATNFQQLADEILRLADSEGLTPVLKLDNRVVLSGPFLTALAESLHNTATRRVRIEVLLCNYGIAGFWRSWRTDRLVSRWGRAIPNAIANAVTVERRTILSRAAGPSRPLVVGIAMEKDPLPEWTQSLRVTFRPRHVNDIQLVLSQA
jgi:hypothetical protein